MKVAELVVLSSHLTGGDTTEALADRWSSRGRLALTDHPDFGWRVSNRLAESGQPCGLLRRREYRWIQAAVQLLRGKQKASRRLADAEAVSAALALFQSDSARPVLNSCLVTSGATVQTVAEALRLSPEVVHAYGDLFFNVLHRREDFAYIRTVVATRSSDGLLIGNLPPTEEEALLQVGFRGTIEDVLRQSGCSAGGANDSVGVLSERILRNILLAGDAWTGSARSLLQTPPALVKHAIDHVKKLNSEATEDTPPEFGGTIGQVLGDQLKMDGDFIREGIVLLAQAQEKTSPPTHPHAA